ncbi:MAG: hypothetical protein U0176_12260 [Bacteroidia bacterium]
MPNFAASLQYLMVQRCDRAQPRGRRHPFLRPAQKQEILARPDAPLLEEVVDNKAQLTHKTAHARVIHQLALKPSGAPGGLITGLFNQVEGGENFRSLHTANAATRSPPVICKAEEKLIANRPVRKRPRNRGKIAPVPPNCDQYKIPGERRKAPHRAACQGRILTSWK